jgi:periplasmic divalent cation tolerance protein
MATWIVFSSFPDEARARETADRLVGERLAACVNILPGLTSVYRWEGKIEAASEVLLLIKTSEGAYPQLESALKACHPYELPEILAVATVEGLPQYLRWVEQETAPSRESA